MIIPYFSSTSAVPLREVIFQFLEPVSVLAKNHTIEIHIMVFSFTDSGLCNRLIEIARSNPNVMIRIIADWGLISDDKDRKIRYLAEQNLDNLRVRLLYDQPYLWNPEKQRLDWNYQTSLGLLHHRTIALFVDGKPFKLLSGSYNPTKQAEKNYENLVEFRPGSEGADRILWEIEQEFHTLWCDPELSVDFRMGLELRKSIKKMYIEHPEMSPLDVRATVQWAGGKPFRIEPPNYNRMVSTNEVLAFSSRVFSKSDRRKGFSSSLWNRQFMMMSNSGSYKKVPVDLSTLLLDLIFRSKEGSLLRFAIFALSPRVPEYGALLEASRRGVRIRIILGVKGDTVNKVREVARAENLPLEIRSGGRCMHQKYAVDLDAGNVLTGTANMTTDASERHAEHRFLIKANKDLALQFANDFDAIWKRMTPEREEEKPL